MARNARQPRDALVNGSALLDDLAPHGRALHASVLRAETHAARIAELENWVRAAVTRATAHDRAVIAACRLLSERRLISVGEVAERLGWNARTMHRQFAASCGYSPKHLQRIMRLQSFLRGAHAAQQPSLSSLAIAAGYSDQAHMTRDFRAITGFTPSAYLDSDARPEWSAWISQEW